MKAIVVSLNFNPGHFSHLIANYKLFADLNYKPYLFINNSFTKMDVDDKYEKVYNLEGFSKSDIKVAVFWFPSLNNIWQIIKLKFFFRSKIVSVFHEPFDSFKNYYKSGFGFIKVFKIFLINLLNILQLFLSDDVILPSNSSFFLYNKKYKWINGNVTLIPLLFDDESDGLIKVEDKIYISYIGTVAADHAYDKFVSFAKTAMENNWFSNYTFLIATGSLMTETEKNQLKKFVDSGKMMIVEGSPMSNNKINGFYEKSAVVWNAYNRSMQSGVLPKAFMFGTPVVLLKKNANEFVDNKINSVFLENNDDVYMIKAAINIIVNKQVEFKDNCRDKFLNTFYYKNKVETFKNLIG
jgi:hypothetical protein